MTEKTGQKRTTSLHKKKRSTLDRSPCLGRSTYTRMAALLRLRMRVTVNGSLAESETLAGDLFLLVFEKL